ncbi:MAG: tRNA 4-thiouridine(8) synthase ThiI [Treponema sp.]|jgi:thiamine biosynthesis protein ThiI|nr:tRNA 4-thiouridine(8) synthase ThiI [Treponema sp.]
MRLTWLIKPGELTLKGGNRKSFEAVLKRNLQTMLSGRDVQIVLHNGRFYLHTSEHDQAAVEGALSRLMGISGWAQTRSLPKTIEAVTAACVEEGKKLIAQGIAAFKIEARRTDKSFPHDSFALRCSCGQAVLDGVPGLKVDVHQPGAVIYIEIREKAYIYSDAHKGLGGLPVGTAGRGLLLLSGGIDSPVAGFFMASRGMGIDAVHFHAYPYTSAEARQKTVRLAEIIGGYCMGIRLYIVGFTKVQMRIKESAPPPWATVLLRMAMMDCAEKIARKIKSKCLITGESLSQVASQTIENLSCTENIVTLPVLRPLIGMDKDSIIRKAEQIGTYSTSIEPYQDCCVLFSPPHPILRGDPAEAITLYESLELEPLIEEALREYETVKCGYPLT